MQLLQLLLGVFKKKKTRKEAEGAKKALKVEARDEEKEPSTTGETSAR